MNRARRKLSEADVIRIREVYASDTTSSYQTLADQYGVTRATIAAIIARRTWRDVGNPREAGK